MTGRDAGLDAIECGLTGIRSEMLAAEEQFASEWKDLSEGRRDSARNLLHYLALRRRDLRSVQGLLASRGLSSLGRSESRALANLEAVLEVVRLLADSDLTHRCQHSMACGDLLDKHTRALLGAAPHGRDVRIMVTMPSEAADDYTLVRDLLTSGMDCMRINAAHDTAHDWDRMVGHLERARKSTGRPCRILIDLAGPKLRTGPIQPASPVVRWRPRRDACGRVLRPARIWLTSRDNPRPPMEAAAAVLPVGHGWLAGLSVGDVVKLFDARDSMRALTVVELTEDGAWAESVQTAYVVPGTTLHLARGRTRGSTEVGDLPSQPQPIVLAPGDTLMVTRSNEPGQSAALGKHGEVLAPASIGLTIPEVLDDVRPGQAIWFDDGRIGGTVKAVTRDGVEVTITRTKPGGAKLGADKGINLPDTTLRLPALTLKDREDLRFIDGRADLVGYSFVRTAADVRELQAHLAGIGAQLGIVLKIETRQAFEQLPSLLLAAMRSPSAGVMIARGDLAVECGYERLAEIQEEILWLAEASHTPVIWATQVLENLAKDGMPSRAEITDAAMSERAECVMLNKGPYILEAVRTLDDILKRMQEHQHKKSPQLRELGLARRFLNP